LNTLAAITDKKAGFRSLGDTWADTTTPHGRLMLTVLGGLAEFERELIRARTGEGRERAKRRGDRFGRKPKLTPAAAQRSFAPSCRRRGNPRRAGPALQCAPKHDFTARSLLALALGVFERLAQIAELFVLLFELQLLLLGPALPLAVDPTRHFEIELLRAILERTLFLAQRELGLLRLLTFAPLAGEPGFEELLFHAEIRARLLLGLARREPSGVPRSRGGTALAEHR
jgi:hypothetical protein